MSDNGQGQPPTYKMAYYPSDSTSSSGDEWEQIYKLLAPTATPSSSQGNVVPGPSGSSAAAAAATPTPAPPNPRPPIIRHKVISEWELGQQLEDEHIARRSCLLLSPQVLGNRSLSDPAPPIPRDLDLLHKLLIVVGLARVGYHDLEDVGGLLWDRLGVDMAEALAAMGEGIPKEPLLFWGQMAEQYGSIMTLVEVKVKKVTEQGQDPSNLGPLKDRVETKHILYFPNAKGAKDRWEAWLGANQVTEEELEADEVKIAKEREELEKEIAKIREKRAWLKKEEERIQEDLDFSNMKLEDGKKNKNKKGKDN